MRLAYQDTLAEFLLDDRMLPLLQRLKITLTIPHLKHSL